MSRYHRLRISDIHKETDDSVVIEFDVPEELKKAFHYEPGQHLNVRTNIKDEDVRRSYSICAIPEDGLLRIGVKHVEGGAFSTFANEQALPGDFLEVMSPQGNFTHEYLDGQLAEYVFFAAGSGITPVISLIKSILAYETASRVLLFYGNKNSESIMFRDELEDLKNKYTTRFSLHHVLSRELLDGWLNQGRIDTEKCEAWSKVFFQPKEVDQFYLCGPEDMILSVRDWLRDKGVDSNKIHFELFTTPTSKKFAEERTPPKRQHDPSIESKVRVTVDGVTTAFTLPYKGESLLDAAMHNGADVPFSCKGGVCCTCKAKLVEGEVDMDVVYGLEPDEIEAGYILTCQAHPVSESVDVDYDQ